MKKLLFLFILVPLISSAQGTSIRANGGVGTNLTVRTWLLIIGNQTNTGVLSAGTLIGSGTGVTNVPIAGITTPGFIVTNLDTRGVSINSALSVTTLFQAGTGGFNVDAVGNASAPTNVANQFGGGGAGISNVTASSVSAALTNQFRNDSTNAALTVLGNGSSNVTFNVNNINVTSNLTVNQNLTVNNKFTGNSALVQNFFAGDTTITNGTYYYTNAWAGPTNTIDLRLLNQNYDTLVPLSIQGFTSKSNTVSETVVLTLRNLSSTTGPFSRDRLLRCTSARSIQNPKYILPRLGGSHAVCP